MTITEARDYINFNINEGIWSPEQFEGMTDFELVNFASYEMAKADDEANRNEYSDDDG